MNFLVSVRSQWECKFSDYMLAMVLCWKNIIFEHIIDWLFFFSLKDPLPCRCSPKVEMLEILSVYYRTPTTLGSGAWGANCDEPYVNASVCISVHTNRMSERNQVVHVACGYGSVWRLLHTLCTFVFVYDVTFFNCENYFQLCSLCNHAAASLFNVMHAEAPAAWLRPALDDVVRQD